MHFDLSISNQVEGVERYLKRKLYKGLHAQVGVRNRFSILLLGIGAGVSIGLITVSRQVALIFEAVIKGSINSSLVCCVKGAVFSTGLKQLLCQGPYEIVALPFSILYAGFGLLSKPFHLMRSPLDYSERMWLKLDPKAKKAREDAAKAREDAAKNAAKNADFKRALGQASQHPSKVEHLRVVGSYYLGGHGIAQDRDKAIEYYTAAANLDDVPSMKMLAQIFDASRTEESRKQSLEWYTKAAEALDLEAMHEMGLLCWNLEGRRQEGFNWFTTAANAGHGPSKDYLKKIT